MRAALFDATLTGLLTLLALPTRLVILGLRWAVSPSEPTPLDTGRTTCTTCGEGIVLSRMNTCAGCGFVSASSLILPCEACGEEPSPYVQCTCCGASNEVRP